MLASSDFKEEGSGEIDFFAEEKPSALASALFLARHDKDRGVGNGGGTAHGEAVGHVEVLETLGFHGVFREDPLVFAVVPIMVGLQEILALLVGEEIDLVVHEFLLA